MPDNDVDYNSPEVQEALRKLREDLADAPREEREQERKFIWKALTEPKKKG